MKLENLSSEQEARLPEFRDFGLRIGLRTSRTDQDKANKAIIAHYHACGLAAPKEIRWFDSPLASVGESVGASVGESVRESVWESVGASVGASVWASVWASVGESVGASVGESVRESVWESVGASVWASVGASVGESVWESVGESVWESVRESVGAHYDADDAAWMMAWDQYGVSLPKAALTFIEVSKHVWWWQPYADIAYASEPPSILNRDEAGALHAEDCAAVEFTDGFSIFSWHGTQLPKEWVLDRQTIDPEIILSERDIERRAAGIQCYGYDRLFDRLNGKVLHDSGDPSMGQLCELAIPGLREPGRFLRAHCPRNGTIFEGVPIVSEVDGLPIDTALAAQAWRIGDPQSEYQHPTVRT